MRPPVSMGHPRYPRIAAAAAAILVTAVTMLGGLGVLPVDPAAQAVPPVTGTGPTLPDRPAPSTSRTDVAPEAAAEPPLPEDSGRGRRVVFATVDQRVWLVGRQGAVQRTYPVSGSVLDNLVPGRYEVYSTSRHAYGIDDSGTMQYFVRFAHGAHAAIGFHSIPTKDGRRLQTRAELGTPQSHGCIRQALPDAEAMWAFAPVGTKVVVTA